MARDLTANFIAQLIAGKKTTIVFFEGVFSTGTARFWSGLGDLSWNGYTWTGAGILGSMSPTNETAKVGAEGITVALSGIPSEQMSLALSEVRQNKAGKMWVGFLDDNGDVVADPYLAFVGRLDVSVIDDDGKEIKISLSYESKLRDLERSRDWRYTPESQAVLHPGDKGFDYVASLQDFNGVWGRS